MKNIFVLLLFIFACLNYVQASHRDEKGMIFSGQQTEFAITESCKPDSLVILKIFEERDKQYISFNEVIEKYFQGEKNTTDFLKKYMLSDGQSLRYAVEGQMLQIEPFLNKLFLISKHFVNSGDGN